jgi:hypothetical protein
LTNPATCSSLLVFKSSYILKEITDINELVVNGERILVADSTECGRASQQHSAMADFGTEDWGRSEIHRSDT